MRRRRKRPGIGRTRLEPCRNQQTKKISPSDLFFGLAGPAGFEPANDGTKTRCLTTWRQPNAIIILPQWSATVKTCKNPKQVV